MNPQDVVDISNAKGHFDSIIAMNTLFVEHLKKTLAPQDVQATLACNNNELATHCFGHTFTAIPRVVRDGQGLYYIEYEFQATHAEQPLAIWRFYLSSGGSLSHAPNAEASRRICDYNNQAATKHILVNLLTRALKSSLFSPAQPQMA